MSTNLEQFQRMVGQRIRLARKELGLSQEQLAALMEFPVRQTLSAIEDGKRKLSAEELVRFIQVLKKDLEYFTDPFLLLGEAQVSWRAADQPKSLEDYERKILPVVAAYRHLGSKLGLVQSALIPQLPINAASSFEQAEEAAERLVRDWNLSKTPAGNLAKVAEEKLNLLVLMVDAPRGISGAAVHLPELDSILINRNEPIGRRNYDFGHELFHVLTWHSMPPPRLDMEAGKTAKSRRMELLADSFTSSLLMPAATVRELWETKKQKTLLTWLKESSTVLGVSSPALMWRLVNLGCLSKAEAEAAKSHRLAYPPEEVPRLYSQAFVNCLYKALDQGLLSVRKTAGILDCTIEDLEELFQSYGLKPPFDL